MGTVRKIAVMGDREFDCKETVGTVLTRVILAELGPNIDGPTYSDAILLLGGASGVDQTAREWAEEVNNTYVLFKPAFMVDPEREHNPRS